MFFARPAVRGDCPKCAITLRRRTLRPVRLVRNANHVHTLFTPRPGWAWSEIAGSWRSFTAKQCNRALGRTGRFWQRDPFDRYIRDRQHFDKTLRYIENNPVKAKLCKQPEDWPWSSAYWREKKEEEG